MEMRVGEKRRFRDARYFLCRRRPVAPPAKLTDTQGEDSSYKELVSPTLLSLAHFLPPLVGLHVRDRCRVGRENIMRARKKIKL